MAEELEHVDVLIVGAGLSGIGAACHLQRDCPDKSFAILEARDAIGGTWDLFRYPGVRSDSDMFTLGYSFAPWRDDTAIADGSAILAYIRDTAREFGVEQRVRFGHRVLAARWSTAERRWTVTARRGDSDAAVRLTCDFLYGCTGYYDYDVGYLPQFVGVERFAGDIVHPQRWPEDLDCRGRRVVVIGSGATAITLVPALAQQGAHVTMLQRSPSYVIALPGSDPIARALDRRRIPAKAAYAIVRWKNILLTTLGYQLCRRAPGLMRSLIRKGVASQLTAAYDVDTHFNPPYEPWDQRMCVAPDGDLFTAVRGGGASIVTDRIETFTETGIQLASGNELEADVIVTATGLNLRAFGGIEMAVDGRIVEPAASVGYKGMMLSGVPNLAFTIGYTNASWTLRADLVAGYVCRLLNYMEAHGYATVTPQGPDPSLALEPLLPLKSGYIMRALDRLPKQGATAPWRVHQNYLRDLQVLRRGPIDDHVQFARRPARTPDEGRATAFATR